MLKIQHFLKRKPIAVIVILILLILAVIFFVFRQKGNSGELGQMSTSSGSYEKCSVKVEQPACQKEGSPSLTLKWSDCLEQKIILIQIDDTVENKSDFPHPEYDSGEIQNDKQEYTFSPTSLKPGTAYHASITFTAENGEMSGWRDTGLYSFVFNDFCK